MGQLADAQKEVTITSEATERELELEAQLVEARSIIQEQVFTKTIINHSYWIFSITMIIQKHKKFTIFYFCLM